MTEGLRASVTVMDWTGLLAISFVLPAALTLLFHWLCKKAGLYTDEDLKLNI